MAVVGVVAAPVQGLLAEPAHDGGHVPRPVVDDADGGLEQLAVLGGIVQVAPVEIDLLRQGLGGGVVAGVDAQAAALEGLVGHLVRPAVLADQGPAHVGDHCLLVPGVNLSLGLLSLGPDKAQLLGHRLVVLRAGDLALVQHLVEHHLLAVLVPLAGVPYLIGVHALGAGEGVGAVFGGVVGNADQAGALGQGQL